MTTIEYEGRRYNEVKRKALVGELVKIISCNMYHGLDIGAVRTLTGDCKVGQWYVEERDGRDRDYVVLEPAPIVTIGQRVKVVGKGLRPSNALRLGDIGTVVEEWEGQGMFSVDVGGLKQWVNVAELQIVETPKVAIGDWVRSTTGRSWAGLNVPTHESFQVYETLYDRVHTRDVNNHVGPVLSNGTYVIVEAPVAPVAPVAVGDWVRSTTGRSQIGYAVPTNVEYEVIRVFLSGNVNVDSDDVWGTLDAGTFEVVRRKDNPVAAEAPKAAVTPKAQETPQTPLGAYIDANYAVMRSYYQRTPDTWRQGDIVDLTEYHPAYSSGKRRTLGTPWDDGDGFAFDPAIDIDVCVRGGSFVYATLVTPVELRTDLSADEKLRLIGANA